MLAHTKAAAICGVSIQIKRCPPDISKLKALCEQLDVLDYVYYCVCYTGQVFDDPMLTSYQTALYTDKSESILPTFGLAEDEKREWDIPFVERLFSTNIGQYFAAHLPAEEMKKIRLNREYM